MDKSVLAIYADIYYVGDLDYDEKSLGTLLLYYYDDESFEKKISGDDKTAIEEYLKQ